jgi:hypothetical protein
MAQFLEGTPAVLNEQSPIRVLRQGNATIAAGTYATGQIADARVTLNSVIICWGLGALDGVPATPTGARTFCVDTLSAGGGFFIRSQGAAVADKSVGWAILQY